jgi:peptide/nickel transport system substrate-binding protein
MERAAFLKSWADKKYKNIIQCGSGAFGNAATRLSAFVVGGGTYAYGSYADIDELFKKQAVQLDPKQRRETLTKIQQLVHEKTVVAPIWQLAFINGVGSRVGESGFGLISDFAYTAPYEDLTLKT